MTFIKNKVFILNIFKRNHIILAKILIMSFELIFLMLIYNERNLKLFFISNYYPTLLKYFYMILFYRISEEKKKYMYIFIIKKKSIYFSNPSDFKVLNYMNYNEVDLRI